MAVSLSQKGNDNCDSGALEIGEPGRGLEVMTQVEEENHWSYIIGHFSFVIWLPLVASPNNSGALMLGAQASSPAGFN